MSLIRRKKEFFKLCCVPDEFFQILVLSGNFKHLLQCSLSFDPNESFCLNLTIHVVLCLHISHTAWSHYALYDSSVKPPKPQYGKINIRIKKEDMEQMVVKSDGIKYKIPEHHIDFLIHELKKMILKHEDKIPDFFTPEMITNSYPSFGKFISQQTVIDIMTEYFQLKEAEEQQALKESSCCADEVKVSIKKKKKA